MNIPKLRFKEFTDDWKTHKLKNICYINPKSSNLNDKFYYIDLECVQSGRLKYIQCINKLEAPSRAQRVLLPQDILFQSVRAYQKNSYFFKKENDIQTVASTGYAQLRTKKELSLYIYYYLYFQKFIDKVNKLSTGTSYPAINSTDLGMININIPSFQEQEKIANFLSTVDKKIENLENTITSLENQKKGLLQQIFSQKLRFKDKNGNNYPNWEKKKLGQYINYKKGYAFKSELYTNKGIRIIRVSDLSATSIKNDSPIYISRSLYTNYLDWKLYTNDIIITTVGSKPPIYDSMVGKVILFPDNLPYKCFLNQNAVIIRACTQVNQKFLYYTLSLNKYINHIKNILRGNANQANITLVDLFEYKIPLPCLEEQTKIADFLSAFDRKLDNQKAQLEHWQQIKKGLLQQMFV